MAPPVSPFDSRYIGQSPLSAPQNWAVTFLVPVELNSELGSLVHFALDDLQEYISKKAPSVFAKTIEPIRSFLDDITIRGHGRSGRPLIVSLSPNGPESIAADDFGSLNYRAEGRTVQLTLDLPNRLNLEMSDALVLFANGDAFHAISFTSKDIAGSNSAIYALLKFQQITNSPGDDAVRFDFDSNTCSLRELSKKRLLKLANSPRQDTILTTHPLKEVVKANNLRTFAPVVCITSIDDKEWLAELEDLRASDFGAVTTHDPKDNCAHLPEQNGDDVNKALALAGFVQGVCDLPFQSSNELSDALSPIFEKPGLLAFFSHRLIVEVASNWRTLRELQSSIGICPYTLCTASCIYFNLRLVERADRDVSRLVAEDGALIARPMPQLRQLLHESMWQVMAGPSGSLRSLIERRMSMFEHLFAQRITNLFRYEEERQITERIESQLGIASRFDNARVLVSDFKSLMSEVIELGASASGRRIGFLLLVLSLLSLVSVVADSLDLLDLNLTPPLKVLLLGLSALGLLTMTTVFALRDYAAWREARKRRSARRTLEKINRK